MAFIRQIRIIKALERGEREKHNPPAASSSAPTSPASASAGQGQAREEQTASAARRPPPAATAASAGGAASASAVDATSPDADDCSIVGVGHSMGGCVLIMYTLFCRALGRPHWLDKLVLLSPAGMHRHIHFLPRALLILLYRLGAFNGSRPFPMRSSLFQRFAARLLQDLKRHQATGDLMAIAGSLFFGGSKENFVFRYVSFTEYPVGGTNLKVLRHGIQNVAKRDFTAYDYGKEGNRQRYGQDEAPSYRSDYWLLDVPIHFVAGGRDLLVPVANVEEQYALINMVTPGLASLKEFDDAGHLDFTLTLADEIISHVLEQLDVDAEQPRRQPTAAMGPHHTGGMGAVGGGGAAGGSGAGQGRSSLHASEVPPVLHEILAPQPDNGAASAVPSPSSTTAAAASVTAGTGRTVGGATGSGSTGTRSGAGPVDYWSPPRSVTSDPAVVRILEGYATQCVQRRAEFGGAVRSYDSSRLAVLRFPWLAGFSKLDVVLDGFDEEARDLGLI